MYGRGRNLNSHHIGTYHASGPAHPREWNLGKIARPCAQGNLVAGEVESATRSDLKQIGRPDEG